MCIEKIAAAHPKAIILREKDLTAREYKNLAAEVIGICENHGVPCILHSFTDVAVELGCDKIHLPLGILKNLSENDKKHFSVIGASCHSAEDASLAEKLGCSYITAGHIFDTDCKKGLPGRGLNFLSDVCKSVKIPVFAIGGVTAQNFRDVMNVGAKGVCIMSGLMTAEDPKKFTEEFEYAK